MGPSALPIVPVRSLGRDPVAVKGENRPSKLVRSEDKGQSFWRSGDFLNARGPVLLASGAIMEEKVEVRLIAVVGAGAMGSGIAQVAATSGFRVNLSDVSAAVLEKALVSIRKSLARLVKAGTLTETQAEGALSRIATTTDPAEAVSEAQAVIEAVPEDLALKLEVFRRLDGAAPANALLLSNTSELSIAALASATNRRDRVAGMHWFNPPPLMNLIEIVRAEETSDRRDSDAQAAE
jgi:3-hydroxyacyl-CoA dehydrogenase